MRDRIRTVHYISSSESAKIIALPSVFLDIYFYSGYDLCDCLILKLYSVLCLHSEKQITVWAYLNML